METIITVTLSVLGTLAVVSIIWAVAGVRKVSNTNEKILEELKGIHQELDEIHRRIDDELQSTQHQIDDRFREVHDLHEQVMKNLSENVGDLTGSIDRRFDKIYSKLYEKFPELKSGVYATVADAMNSLFSKKQEAEEVKEEQ